MSWDQDYSIQSREDFLLNLLGVSRKKLIEEAIEKGLKEKGLYIAEASREMAELDWQNDESLETIKFSNGKIYTHKLVQMNRGSDWGIDIYEYIEEGKTPITIIKTYNDDGEVVEEREWTDDNTSD